MLELFGRLLLLPWTLFAFSLEATARMMRDVEKQTRQSMDDMRTTIDSVPGGWAEAAPGGSHIPEVSSPSTPTEEKVMSDKNLSDDMVKLVQWSLVSVKRDGERVFRDGEDLVTENLTPDGFTAWVVRKYGCDAVPLNDAMYIRVYYNVLDRWPKQDLHYESRQLRILERIADCVCYDAHRDDREEEGRRGRRREEAAEEAEAAPPEASRPGRRPGAGGAPSAP